MAPRPEPGQGGVVLGRFEYPLMSEGLAAALAAESALKLLAIDVDDEALTDVVARDRPNVVVLDDHRTQNLLLQAMVAAHPETQLVVLTHPPASTAVLELIDHGATCLSKKAPVAEIVATVVLTARGHSVVSRELAVSSRRNPGIHPLTQRERQVFSHLERGDSDSQIARGLQISIWTVRTHNANIFRKLNARRRDLVRTPGR